MDMVRSLSIVLLIAAALLYLHRAPPSDVKRIRVVDPASDIRAFAGAVPGAPLPGFLPAGWRPTSTSLTRTPTRLRIGYVTPVEQYAEYDAQAGDPGTFVADVTAHAAPAGSLTVGGRVWQQLRGRGGALSFVLSTPTVTVVLGSLRDSASVEELTVLAQSLVSRG